VGNPQLTQAAPVDGTGQSSQRAAGGDPDNPLVVRGYLHDLLFLSEEELSTCLFFVCGISHLLLSTEEADAVQSGLFARNRTLTD